jgi:6,7-dimethyl-8-ribityllumazine synthase
VTRVIFGAALLEKPMADRPHVLVIEARFYADLADELGRAAVAVLERDGATYDRVQVPGALELPAALAMAIAGGHRYDGYVILGCVIRGATTHYDIVANESARAIMRLVIEHRLALGFGVLTVENDEQAWERASADRQNKGGVAAEAALAMIAVRERLSR